MNYKEQQEYLAQFHDPQKEEKIAEVLGGMDQSMRAIGYALLNRSKDGQKQVSKNGGCFAYRSGACLTLIGLSHAEREELITLFLPRIAKYVLLGWEMIYERPYLDSYQAPSFRAPQQPERYKCQLRSWLDNLIGMMLRYDQDIIWIAENSYIFGWQWQQTAALLLAAAIDAGDEQSDEVLQTLYTIARGDHARAVNSRYLIGALLCCHRPEALTFVEQMLLSAQRQEGLRQVILETVDMAHPEAFRRMVHLINEQDLVRFNSTVRAVDVWFQLNYDVTQSKEVQKVLLQLERYLDDPALAERAVFDEDPQFGYVALVARGFYDIDVSLDLAEQLLAQGSADQRLMAARFLSITHMTRALELLAVHLDDADQHIVAVALQRLARVNQSGELFFARMEEIVPTLPAKEKELPPRIWPWWKITLDPQLAGQIMYFALDEHSIKKIFPYFYLLDSDWKGSVIWSLKRSRETWDEETRQQLLIWLGDRSSRVRDEVLMTLTGLTFGEEDFAILEGYLTRKSSVLRKGIIKLILEQPQEVAFSSLERLLAAGKVEQRQAGLEMLLKLFQADKQAARCRELARAYEDKAARLNTSEKGLLKQIPTEDKTTAELVTIEDGLGLIDHSKRTLPLVPQEVDFEPVTANALRLLQSLDQCITLNQDLSHVVTYANGRSDEVILGDIKWASQFPKVDIELLRGELPTPASPAAKSLCHAGGVDTLIKLLRAFGDETFVRNYAFDKESKKSAFSHLIRATYPDKDETPALLAERIQSSLISAKRPAAKRLFADEESIPGISETRLVETAVYAPQWAAHIEQAIGWDGLVDGVWWFHAHTKDVSGTGS